MMWVELIYARDNVMQSLIQKHVQRERSESEGREQRCIKVISDDNNQKEISETRITDTVLAFCNTNNQLFSSPDRWRLRRICKNK